MRTGSPAGKMLETASDDKVDTIVMGHWLPGSGSEGLPGGFRGDVVNEVLSRSNVPVLFVPELLSRELSDPDATGAEPWIAALHLQEDRASAGGALGNVVWHGGSLGVASLSLQ